MCSPGQMGHNDLRLEPQLIRPDLNQAFSSASAYLLDKFFLFLTHLSLFSPTRGIKILQT